MLAEILAPRQISMAICPPIDPRRCGSLMPVFPHRPLDRRMAELGSTESLVRVGRAGPGPRGAVSGGAPGREMGLRLLHLAQLTFPPPGFGVPSDCFTVGSVRLACVGEGPLPLRS